MPSGYPAKIKELYSKGWSIRAIASQFHTKDSTVIRYIDKNKFSNRSLSYIKNCESKRKAFFALDRLKIGKIDKEKAKFYTALLYWCEGSKYPASKTLNFTTSDMKMQKLFLSLFRKGFNPIESKFRVWLQFHSEQNREKLFKYWSDILKIPVSQFMKPGITDKKGGRYRRIYYGTCSVRYADYSMILRMMGIYQRFYKRAFSALV